MTETLRHRGPDDSGTAVFGPAGLGHTRLSVIDLSPAAHQPMISKDGKVALVYNGEVYNFREIRKSLENKGVRFRSRSDTEVVLQSYMEWGTDALSMFNGMFALAIWDSRTESLHLARDRFGIKPLYYGMLKEGVVFGSEIKAILASKLTDKGIDWEGFHEYLYYGYALGSHTLFKGLSKLLPGHYMTFNKRGCVKKCYWPIEQIEPVLDNVKEATEKVRSLLEKAVQDHLVSDVPVGVFLSGGIDSSAITAFASKHYNDRISTYSVGFDYERGVDELPMARMIADKFGTKHHELHLEGRNMPQVIERLVRCHDEPFGDAADIPLYLLCEALKGSIKVVLQGDGGDEMFGGYPRYSAMAQSNLWRILPPWIVYPLRLAGQRERAQRLKRLIARFKLADLSMQTALFLTVETLDEPPTRLLTAEARRCSETYNPFQRYQDVCCRLNHLDPVQRMLYTDCLIHLPDCFLEKVDKPTMAHGIEVRVPFLDANLARYAMGLPSTMKIRLCQKKWILRRALRGTIPDKILDGKKRGLDVPFSFWLRGPMADYMKSVLLDQATINWGVFDRNRLHKCIEDHISRQRDSGYLLYKVLNIALWRKFYQIP